MGPDGGRDQSGGADECGSGGGAAIGARAVFVRLYEPGAGRVSFIVSGAGELPEGSISPEDVVRRGETSPEALAEKARFVLGLMEGRMASLGVGWDSVNVTDIYTVHDVNAMLAEEILPRIGAAGRHGVTWHYTRPPIESIEFEMDVIGA